MLKSLQVFSVVCLLHGLGLLSNSSIAQSPFIDQVPAANSGNTAKNQEQRLELKTGVRVVMRSKLGVVVRGVMLSVTKNGPLIVTDRARLRNPAGVEYKFSSLQSLNIPEHDLHWSKGDDAEKFLQQVSESENIEFSNLLEFQKAASSDTTPNGDDPSAEMKNGGNSTTAEGDAGSAKMSSNNKVITMQPAVRPQLDRPTVTIICGNCMKEVSLSSDSGQECPHCNILWDSSPLDAVELAALKQEEAAAAARIGVMNYEQTTGAETGNFGQPAVANAGNGQAIQNNANLAPQPVAAPAPIQTQTQPQEITLENLPLWIKVAIFGACMSVLYYTVFVR